MADALQLRFHTVGGAQPLALHAPAAPSAGAVVVAPALGVRATYYDALCQALAGQGLHAGALDLPGHGQSPVRPGWGCDWGYADLVAHVEAACLVVRRALPDTPVLVLGHSIGGQAALIAAGRARLPLAGVVVVASGSPWWRAWRGAESLGVRAGTAAAGALAGALGHFPGHRVGFGGREARSLIREWSRVARTGAYRFYDLDGEALLAAPGPPVLAIGLRGDRLAPPAAMRHTLDKLRQRQVRFETWEDPPHGGDHNRWPSQPAHVATRVAAFARDLIVP